MIILTHRGLEPSKENFFEESSYGAFKDQLKRGFGIEFDVYFEDSKILVSHNPQKQNKIPSLREVLDLIKENNSLLNALHIKGKFQTTDYLDRLLEVIKDYEEILDKIIIFDLKIESARYLKEKNQNLILAPSIAHEYDIERYNQCVEGTLISIEEALKNKELYDYAWLDEWDLRDREGKKKLYTKEVFDKLRDAGYNIGLVTPELHGTSPALLGNESHEDSVDKKSLFNRIKEIIKLKPDIICTDYPEKVKELI